MIPYPNFKELPKEYVKKRIAEFLEEDIPDGDKTSVLTIDEDENSIADIIPEEDIVFVGESVLPNFFDDSYRFELFAEDGDNIEKGKVIATIKGNTRGILQIERTLLNLLQRMCGIARNVRQYSDIASPYRVKILDTRKTIPGLRLFDKYAVAAAGGFNHRLDLSSGILIKDNHIYGKDLRAALLEIKGKNSDNLIIELEVDNFEQLQIALEVGVNALLLDNFTPEQVADAMQLIRSSDGGNEIYVEVSGGINLQNIEPYLTTGINAISIGAITHSVKAANIHMEFRKK